MEMTVEHGRWVRKDKQRSMKHLGDNSGCEEWGNEIIFTWDARPGNKEEEDEEAIEEKEEKEGESGEDKEGKDWGDAGRAR